MKKSILLIILCVVAFLEANTMVAQKSQTSKARIQSKSSSYLPNFNEKAIVKIINFRGIEMNYEELGGSIFSSVYYFDPRIVFGSGIMLNSNGLILTAYHIIDTARIVIVQVPGIPKPFVAEVIPPVEDIDYAFIKIKGTFPDYINLKKGIKVSRGEPIWTYGFPILFDETEPNKTKGDISRYSTTYNEWQIDATIAPGSSGGALVNLNGDIIGLVVATTRKYAGLNFAVPIDTIAHTLQYLSNEIEMADRKLNEISPEQNDARIALGTFVKNTASNFSSITEEDFHKLTYQMSKINYNILLNKEWALYKEICAIYYFNQVGINLENQKLSWYSMGYIKDATLKSTLNYWLDTAEVVLNEAQRMDKNAKEDLQDLATYIKDGKVKLSYWVSNYDEYTQEDGEIDEESIDTSNGEDGVLWDNASINSLKTMIGLSKNKLTRTMKTYHTEGKAMGEKNCLIYSDLIVALDDNNNIKKIGLPFYSIKQSEKIDAFGGLTRDTKKSEAISILGNNYKIVQREMSADYNQDFYKWKLSDGSNLEIGFIYDLPSLFIIYK